MAQCVKCNKKISGKQYLCCSSCKGIFHIPCTSVSEQRYYSFYALNKAQKSKWSCEACLNRTKKKYSTSSPCTSGILQSPSNSLYENVTNRKKVVANVSTDNSYEGLSTEGEDDYDDSDTLNRSCPELRNPDRDFAEMKKTLSDLQLRLDVADNEISNLLQENSLLKKQIGDYKNTIKNLTQICKSVPKKTPSKRESTSDRERSATPYRVDSEKSFSLSDVTNNSTLRKGISNNKTSNNKTSNDLEIPNSKKFTTASKINNTILEPPNQKKIFILGNEQLRGLPTKINNSRSGKWNDVYKASGMIKTFAPSSYLLNNLNTLSNSINDDDILVISTGCYDNNPHTLYSNLCNVLFQFKRCKKILLISVPFNEFLDVRTLNADLQRLSANYSNCSFIDLEMIHNCCNNKITSNFIAYKINLEIDSLRYEHDYIQNVLRPKNSIENVKDSYSTKLACKSNLEEFFRAQ